MSLERRQQTSTFESQLVEDFLDKPAIKNGQPSSMVYYQEYLRKANILFEHEDYMAAKRQYLHAVFAREDGDPELNHIFYVRLAACHKFHGDLKLAKECDSRADSLAEDNEVKKLRVDLERYKAMDTIIAGMPTGTILEPVEESDSWPWQGTVEDTLVQPVEESTQEKIGGMILRLPAIDDEHNGWPIGPAYGST